MVSGTGRLTKYQLSPRNHLEREWAEHRAAARQASAGSKAGWAGQGATVGLRGCEPGPLNQGAWLYPSCVVVSHLADDR